MRNDQLKQALLRVGFEAQKETQLQRVTESDIKPTWETITQAERDFYADALKSDALYRN
jgi:hypothetical protein